MSGLWWPLTRHRRHDLEPPVLKGDSLGERNCGRRHHARTRRRSRSRGGDRRQSGAWT
ncbi:hypothetical protein LIPSTDRAFT_193970 [Lipomyces starkeyi NRRL Y-11557]|uniref:Uncharacterized protein n=1 Tax=Lipomyces starkeyi NRRL Y-11557 TaxID=675824 RepID=A0A1E3PVD4_LIPST|nr:hypothetical protein LIPSTDRAFT_193970 [Lipomyces starkeyi NRRL Y-11557]